MQVIMPELKNHRAVIFPRAPILARRWKLAHTFEAQLKVQREALATLPADGADSLATFHTLIEAV